LAAGLAVLCATVTLLPAPANADRSYAVDVHDSSADRSRTFAAYEEDSGTLFEIEFSTTKANEKRRIRSHMNFAMPAGSNSGANKVWDTQNVLRGETLVMTPRFTYTAPEPGDYHCWTGVFSSRPRPEDVDPSSNVFTVEAGSHLEATTKLHPGSGQGYEPNTPSVVLENGEAYDAAPLEWTAPDGVDSFTVSGDLRLTTCSATGGSLDPVTGKVLCEGLVDRSGTTLNSRLVIGQRNQTGRGYCALTYYPSKAGQEKYISVDVHHQMLYKGVTARLSTAPDCGRRFRIKVYVQNLRGAALVVHQQGTLTSAIPAG